MLIRLAFVNKLNYEQSTKLIFYYLKIYIQLVTIHLVNFTIICWIYLNQVKMLLHLEINKIINNELINKIIKRIFVHENYNHIEYRWMDFKLFDFTKCNISYI